MTEREPATDPEQLERLRAAFAAAESVGGGAAPAIEPERIWAAARGELGPEETAAIVDRLADDPQLALEWRLALELAGEAVEVEPAAANDRRYLYYLYAGAVAVAAVLLVVTLPRPGQERSGVTDGPQPGLRGAGDEALSTTLAEGAELPREGFELSWSVVADAGRYELRVSTEALDPVFEALELVEPRARVPAAALTGLEPGAVLIWQVTAVTVDGARVSGPLWRVVLR